MEPIIAVYFLVLGLLFGSFFNVVGLRVPMKRSIAAPPSSCGSCGTRLGWKDLMPVISYVISRGTCRHCGVKVSVLYPLGELATGLLFMAAYLYFGLSGDLVIMLGLISLSVIITVSDIRYMLIPNKVLIVFGLAFIPLVLLFSPMPLWQHIAGLAAGGGILLLIALVSRGGMGLGDVKLFAVLGWVLGLANTFIALLAGAMAGTLVGALMLALKLLKRKQPMPFGPFLVVGAMLAYVFGDEIMSTYLSLLGQ